MLSVQLKIVDINTSTGLDGQKATLVPYTDHVGSSTEIVLECAALDYSKGVVYVSTGSKSHDEIAGYFDLEPTSPDADVDEVVYGFLTSDLRFFNREKMLELMACHTPTLLKKPYSEIYTLNSGHIDWVAARTRADLRVL